MARLSLEQVHPYSVQDLDRYTSLIDSVRDYDAVIDHLPEILEEKTSEDVHHGIIQSRAVRFFINLGGVDIGRLELATHLNDDPSILKRVPRGISLGFNTCYFVDERMDLPETIHERVASRAIHAAFGRGDEHLGRAPWLPVSLDGKDVSRGWLEQVHNPLYNVEVGEPQTGIFPQFGIGDNEYSIVYAEKRHKKFIYELYE